MRKCQVVATCHNSVIADFSEFAEVADIAKTAKIVKFGQKAAY